MNKTYLLSIFAALLMISGCTKVEVIDVQGETLVVKEVPVTADSFQLPIIVNETSRVVWKARSLSDWLHIAEKDQTWKQNSYNITVYHDSNESSAYVRNFARLGHIVIETYDGFVADTIKVKQRGLTPFMQLKDTEVEALTTECEVEFNSNLTDACRPTMTFRADDDWVESIEYLGCGTHLLVKFSANGGETRETTLRVGFTDACDNYTEATCKLTQN